MLAHLRLAAWCLCALCGAAFLALPVGTDAQLSLSATIIVGMGATWRWGRGIYARWLFLCLGSMVVLRYVVWRATSTLPPLDQPLNFGFGLLLVLAELYCVLILAISLVINADPLDRKPLEREADDLLPSVDVFIPSYNEDENILAVTIAAAKAMDYPAAKLTVWLLDDGGTDAKIGQADAAKAAEALERRRTLGALCDAMGARYLTRARNEHAKAGNMNNGLTVATGEIVVVFDADHAPFKSFLRETIGHFARDPKLFLVQTPHVFLNPDPIERNLKTFQVMPSENEMFYSVTQRGLDKWDGSFFCGSAALLRRAALDEVGGFSGITITEDCETAFELHAKGWHSAYVDKPLIAGLQPETFESFIGQRSRWCQGMFQILLLKNPLFKKGLRPIQKLAYLSSMTFWFFPLPRMIFTFAPLLHIFFDVKIFVSSMNEALAYTATYMVVNLMLQNYLYGRVRWPFMSELYEYVQGVFLAKAIVSVIAKPRKPSFNVTAKGITLDRDHLSGLARPFFGIFAILLVGTLTAFYRYVFEPGAELMLVVGLWTLFNLAIAGVALGVVAERREPDRFPRLAIDRRGTLSSAGDTLPVAICSVSAGGCALRFDDVVPPALLGSASAILTILPLAAEGVGHAPLLLDLVHATPSPDAVTCGFAFAPLAAPGYAALADLMYGDPDAMGRFQAKRRTHKNLLAGAAQFLWWGASEPWRAISYLGRKVQAPAGALPRVVPAATVPSVVLVDEMSVPVSVAVHASEVETNLETPQAPLVEAVLLETIAQEPILPAAVVPADIEIEALSDLAAMLEDPIAVSVLDDPFDLLEAALLAGDAPVETIDATDWRQAMLRLARAEAETAISHKEDAHAVAA